MDIRRADSVPGPSTHVAYAARIAIQGERPLSYRNAAYLIIVLGCLVAGAAAVVPFYTVGYKVDALALAAVLTPFAFYGMLTASLRGPWLLGAGIVLLAATLAVVIEQRYLEYDGYRAGTVYWVPLLVAAVVLAIAYVLGKRAPYE
jgi:NADH:ubiquinone oxidoreductase subunit K